MSLTRHFSLSEFACKDGTPVPARYHRNTLRLARALEHVRLRLHVRFGKEVVLEVGSGYRTPEHNARVGGAPQSQHLRAAAADLYPHGCTVQELYTEIEQAIEDGDIEDGGLAMSAQRGFVHYDVGPPGRRWSYDG